MSVKQFFPTNWKGTTKMDQQELFDQILTYLTQHELHKTYARKVTHKEWLKKSKKTMLSFAHQHAYDLFKDILNFYRLAELNCSFKNIEYLEDKHIIDNTYAIYDDYFDRCRYSSDCKYYNVHTYISAFTAY
jgi:hypothetical protein